MANYVASSKSSFYVTVVHSVYDVTATFVANMSQFECGVQLHVLDENVRN